MRSKCIIFVSPSGKGGGTIASIKLLESIVTKADTSINVIALGRNSARVTVNHRIHWLNIPWFGDYDRIVGILEKVPLLSFFYTFPILFMISFFMTLWLRKKIAFLYGNGGVCGIIAAINAKLFSQKSMIHIHQDTGLSRRNMLLRFLIKKGLGMADYIVVNSRDVELDLLALGLPEYKLKIVTNWVDLERFKVEDKAATRRLLGFQDDEFIVLYVGRFVEYKGVHILFNTIRENKGEDTVFIFIGQGPLEGEVKDLCARYKNVRFIGFVDDDCQLTRYYNAADILWGAIDVSYPSLAVMEALACGLPVVAPNRPATRTEKVNPDVLPIEVGFLIEPEPEKLQETIDFLKENKGLLSSMRPECRRFAENSYSEHNFENVYQEIFKPLLIPLA